MPDGRFRIRHYQIGDHTRIAEVFTRSVHELTCAEYSAAERMAWAAAKPDVDRWLWRCELHRPFLAVDGLGTVAAFLELGADGHIGCAYVHPAFARRGAMTLLMDHAQAVSSACGIECLVADVSLTAQPFFRARGWSVVRVQQVQRAGVALANARMEKQLSVTS